ncbi:MAG: transglutaminase-like cysteine peptidase [Chromatiales bacterium]|nr:transglutaminase-like cysteine peptidase [Chromatiales bacterium]
MLLGRRLTKCISAAGILLFSISALTEQSQYIPFIDKESLDRLEASHGRSARYRGEALNRLIENYRGSDVTTKLIEVNRFFNQFSYLEDAILWGENDYWQTPVEFLGKNSGDCEDYVIAKYFTLIEMGVDEKQLYLTYVKAVKENAAHMVLSYYETPGSVPLILDNYNKKILEATIRKDLMPVYSFNGSSLFLSGSVGLGRALPTDKVKNSKWTKLLERVKRAKP